MPRRSSAVAILSELSRDEEVVGAAEQPLLILGHLDNQRRLGGRHAATVGDELFHGPRFLGRDLMVGAGDAAQDESERGEVPGARWFEPVKLGGDAVDGIAVGFRVAGETKKGQDRAHRSILPAFANARYARSYGWRARIERPAKVESVASA